ncbi:MAG: preprotein translocase subunit SecG [Clostridia bacterium]|nr:preprotein translocase subunit SecG [Clostridia bacterium]
MIFALASALATTPIYVLGGILIALAVALIVLVLMQSGKDKGLSGTIAGGAETFFGKNKGSTLDKILSKLTIVISVAVVAIVITLIILITKAV